MQTERAIALLAALALTSPAILHASSNTSANRGSAVASSNALERFNQNLFGDGSDSPAPIVDDATPAIRPATVTTFTHSRADVVPKKLAQDYPPEARAGIESAFTRLLHGYKEIEKRFAIPENDVAGAVAAFVAGSWMGYGNRDFPDDYFLPLVNQMRLVIANNPEFQQAGNSTRQEMYEHMAILGMMMAKTQMALKEKNDPQAVRQMKQTAKSYLEQFFKVDASEVRITEKGLILR